VSNLFFPIGTIMADRLLCLPAAGFLACLVLAVYALAQRAGNPRLAPLVLAVVTTAFAVRTWARNPDWQTDLTLATATVRASPNSFKAHRLMAAALFESDPEHARIDQVIEQEEKSLALLDPLPAFRSRADAYRVAGYYYLVKGDQMRARGQTQNTPIYQKAIRSLSKAIAIDQVSRPAYRASLAIPDGDSEAYFLLSAAYIRAEDPAKALEAGTRARSLNPLNPQIYRQLADVFAAEHREDESSLASMEAEVITAVERGQWQEAAELSERVMQLKPGDFPSGYYLSAMANLHLGKLELAEKNAREAIRLDTGHRNPRANYVLGLILAQKGDFRRSAEALRAYLDALPGAPDAETARQQLAGIEESAATP
jgi:tetratricopeptide (TPR) repeat protein